MNKSKSMSRTNIEITLARSVSVFTLVIYAFALPDILSQIPVSDLGWDLIFIVGIPVAVVWTVLVRRPGFWLRVAAGTSAILVIVSFLLWHFGLIADVGQVESRPWSWGIAGIGIGLACIATGVWFSAVYGAVFSLLLLIVPLSTAGNIRGWHESWQDALLTAAMTVVIVSPITALRRAATASDNAAAAAVLESAAVAKAQALRIERTRLDGLTHDTVMATLNVAARAQSAEMTDAAAHAALKSMQQLESLHTKDETSSMSPDELVLQLRAATAGYQTLITRVDPTIDVPIFIPIVPGQALIQATAEAVRNSSLHTREGGSEVTVSFSRDSSNGSSQVMIIVSDGGPGFDLAQISPQRLGIRVSIIKRMQDACGHATITSTPAAGTRVQLIWQENLGQDE